MRKSIPLGKRPFDWVYLGFFLVNLIIVTYSIDLEQIVIKDPFRFSYPAWPLPFFIDMVHWWGRTFDPLLMARPVWWQATIWLDVLIFGPFYAFAAYAFYKGKDWIRIPTLVIMPILFTNVTIICSEEIWGPFPARNLPVVLLANASWFLFPVFLVWKMAKKEHPFTEEQEQLWVEDRG
ncbi:MAG TPA: hypothetical protein VMC08_07635 [Bacteroidales bacterium]|nr:hypothetical protein [Bacteroidales bacterium]